MPGVVSAFAQVVRYRCEKLNALEGDLPTPVLDSVFSLHEPKTGTDGTLSWTVDIQNPATDEDFVLGLKEITLPDGVTRPYSMWLSGNYPRATGRPVPHPVPRHARYGPGLDRHEAAQADRLPGTLG